MEIRAINARLEVQEQQLHQLQADVNEIKATLQVLEVDRRASVAFRRVMFTWMKHHDTQKVDGPSGSGSGVSSGLFSSPNITFGENTDPTDITGAVKKSITWPEFQSELLQRFHGFAISTPSKQSDSIHDSLPDVVDGKNVASVSSTVSPAPFSYSIGYGLLLNDGLSEVGQPQPNSTFNFFLAERDFQPRLLLGHDQFDNGKGERLLLEADNSPNQVESWMKFIHEEHSLMLQDLTENHSTKWGHVLHHDRGVLYPSRLDWKGRKKKRMCLRWGNRYGSANKCPDGKTQGMTNDSLPSLEDKTFK
ncbi:hypothetical protein R6Q59_016435 [Mikania micrantha]